MVSVSQWSVKAATFLGGHRFRQGMPSFHALRFAADAREELVKLTQTVQPIEPGLAPKKVIFAIALIKNKEKGNHAISQISLVHTVRMLELAGIGVEVIDISPPNRRAGCTEPAWIQFD